MTKSSLVLVTVDCMRADHVSFLDYSRPTTPHLDSLAKESLVFPLAIVAGAPTYFSFPAVLASRFPLAFGRDILGIAPGESTLASVLQASGRATAGFVAGNPYLSSRFGYDQGFDSFETFLTTEHPDNSAAQRPSSHWLPRLNSTLEKMSRRTRVTALAYEELYFRYCQLRAGNRHESMDTLRPYPAADVLVDRARSWLCGMGDRPFFLWLHLMDPHHPYYPPEQAMDALGVDLTPGEARFVNSFWNRENVSNRRLKRHRDQIVSLYDAGIRWADAQIARLVVALQHSGRWDKTVFVVTADHGEEFLEHKRRYHSPVDLAEELIHVPLLLRVPGVNHFTLPNVPFSLIHLAPTLLDLMNVPIPPSFQGLSYWPQISTGALPDLPVTTECIDGCNNPFFADNRLQPRILAVRSGSYKLVIHFGGSIESLYDLKKDPAEQSPLPANENKSERARLLQLARQHLQNSRQNWDSERRLRARVREFCQETSKSTRNLAGY